MDNGTWIRTKTACQHFGITPTTLRRWADTGLVVYKRTPCNQRVYRISGGNIGNTAVPGTSVDTIVENPVGRVSYVYVRVSSAKQRSDLERQAGFLQARFGSHCVIKDIGSGLNFKRRGLLRLVDACLRGTVEEVVVASKDRLCRFGFDLVEHVFKQCGTRIVVLDNVDKSPETEFSEDILAILQVFACRWNGKRKYRVENKKSTITLDIDSKEPAGPVETRV